MSIEVNPDDIFKTLSAPIDLQIEITSACNERCSHCYNFWRVETHQEGSISIQQSTLNKDQISFIFDELKRNSIFGVTFSGGEPLLYYEILAEGVRLAQGQGIKCSINSNLTTITHKQAEYLGNLGIDSMLTSLHSLNEEDHEAITQKVGSFNQTIRGIRVCEDVGLNVGVNMVVTEANKDQVIETGRFLKDLGIKYFAATRGGMLNNSEMGISYTEFRKMLDDLLFLEKNEGLIVDSLTSYPMCGLEDLDRYSRFINRNCAAGVTTGTIGSDGSFRPCSFADENYGNIFVEPMIKIWKKMKDWRDGSRIPESCLQECDYFYLCRGGCRIEAKHQGNKKGMDPLAANPPSSIKPLTPENVSLQVVLPNYKYRFFSGFRSRKEDFGGIIYSKEGTPMFLDQSAYNLISILYGISTSFSYNEIKDPLNLSESSQGFLFSLAQAGFLELIK